jgi:hypothetical protein
MATRPSSVAKEIAPRSVVRAGPTAQPLSGGGPATGSTHSAFSSQTAGATQSSTLRQDVRHSEPPHVYGVQFARVPSASPTVERSTHDAPETQVPDSVSHREPGGQALSDVHDVGHVVDVPSQAYGAHPPGPDVRALRRPHFPVKAAQLSHGPSHADSQHTPSAQCPLVQSELTAHPRPIFCLHSLVDEQIRSPEHVSGSSASTTLLHLPFVPAHVSQKPVHTRSQQNPSEHARVEQSSSFEHVAPGSAPDPMNRACTRALPTPGV